MSKDFKFPGAENCDCLHLHSPGEESVHNGCFMEEYSFSCVFMNGDPLRTTKDSIYVRKILNPRQINYHIYACSLIYANLFLVLKKS